MKNTDTAADFKYNRALKIFNDEDDEFAPDDVSIVINFPDPKCRELVKLIFKEEEEDGENEISFDQFCEFDTIANLDLLKRSLSERSDILHISDEDLFTKFFIDMLPDEDERKNDSYFSIYTFLISYFQIPRNIMSIVCKCISNISDDYFKNIFIAICTAHPFNNLWEILSNELEYQEHPIDFLKASSGLIKKNINPPNRDEFITRIIEHPITGVFNILIALHITSEEIDKYEIESLLIEALQAEDHQLNTDALEFLRENDYLYLLQNTDITDILFSMLGNYKQKERIIVFFDRVLPNLPIGFVESLVEKGIIENAGELLTDISLPIQFAALGIIHYFIKSEIDNVFTKDLNIIDLCSEEDLYNNIFELTNSPNEYISKEANDIINSIDSLAE